MYTPEEISRFVAEVRKDLKLFSLVQPEILRIRYSPEDDSMLIIAADRPDKAALLGPGGRVLKTVRDRLGIGRVAARSQTQIMIKRFRVALALKAAKKLLSEVDGEAKEIVRDRILPMLRNELKYPERRWLRMWELPYHGIAVAYSGGVDSTASLLIAKLAGLNPIAVTVDAGGWMIPPHTKRIIEETTKNLNIPHRYLKPKTEIFNEILSSAVEGRKHPCKDCHCQIEHLVMKFCKENHIPIVGFGDLLPTGRYSIYMVEKGLVRFNVAAALSLTKTDTILASKRAGHPGSRLVYGCPLLRSLHKRHHHFRYVSIGRVLRELRAQVLEPSQALRYVKSIIG